VHDTGTHTTHGYGKRGPWAGEKRNGAAYVMPDRVGKMASLLIIPVKPAVNANSVRVNNNACLLKKAKDYIVSQKHTTL